MVAATYPVYFDRIESHSSLPTRLRWWLGSSWMTYTSVLRQQLVDSTTHTSRISKLLQTYGDIGRRCIAFSNVWYLIVP